MIRNSLDCPDTQWTKEIKTQRKFEPRERVNKYFIALPVLATLTNITFLVFTNILAKDCIGNPFSSEIGYLYYYILLIPFVIILISLAYFIFLYVFKNLILKTFIVVTSLPSIITVITGIFRKAPAVYAIGSVLLFIEIIYLWVFWADINIVVISIKTAIIQLNKNRIKLLKLFTAPVTFYLCSLSLIVFNILFGVHYLETETENTYGTKTASVWQIFFILILLSWVYTTEYFSAILQIYGAAVFDQTSIMLDSGCGDIDYDHILERAFSIAFRSSLGTACVGALFITLTRLFISHQDDDKNDSLFIKILKCIMMFIQYLTAQAYVYSAIYGKGLFESGRLSVDGFKTTGLGRMLNFVFVDRLLNFLCFSFSLNIVVALFYYSIFGKIELTPNSDYELLNSVLISLIIPITLFQVLYVVNSLISGHTACQIAVYVEDPARFKKTHRRAKKLENILRFDDQYEK